MSTTDAWELTRRLSPRDDVRIAAHVVDGVIINVYDGSRPLSAAAPTTPWAMHLADEAGYFCWLGFDFDAGKGNPGRDCVRLQEWLVQLGIDSETYRSGPTGGRHLWVKADHLHPAVVNALAHRARSLLPSLDISPLTNARTGALRPPMSPHRLGGVSEPIGRSDPEALRVTTTEGAEALITLLDALGADQELPMTAGIRGMAIDSDGYPHMAGAERQPSARIQTLMTQGDPHQPDKSRVQATVLAGLARAHWRFESVLALLDHSPALEHSRSTPVRDVRVPRPPRAAFRVLRTAWNLAVRYVAANPTTTHVEDDTGFLTREIRVVADVHALQMRADAQPGRWGLGGHRSRGGRPSARAVLDAVCLYALQAVRTDVEVDTRRLSADTGYGRESCRLALLALVEDGWLSRTAPAVGVHGATYRLREDSSTDVLVEEWSQVVTRPAPLPSRTPLIHALGTHLRTLAADTFCAPHSLGRLAGRIFRSLSSPGTVPDIAARSSELPPAVHRSLMQLHSAGLIDRVDGRWQRASKPVEQVATERHVAGFLAARAFRYDVEREVWAWWCAEVGWMRAPRPKKGRADDPTATPLVEGQHRGYARYPRRARGRPDHAYARLIVAERALGRKDSRRIAA